METVGYIIKKLTIIERLKILFSKRYREAHKKAQEDIIKQIIADDGSFFAFLKEIIRFNTPGVNISEKIEKVLDK